MTSPTPKVRTQSIRMSQSPPTTINGLDALRSTVETTITLIRRLQASAALPTTNNQDVNALDLAHDTAILIRAHSTKISLLIINKPFTPSAITKILRELVAGPLPGLASAVELCDPGSYTQIGSSELQYLAAKVFTELSVLVQAIPLNGQVLSNDAKNGTGTVHSRGSLAVTGSVWEACDAVVELRKMGIAGLILSKIEQYRDLVKDALEELQDWSEETGSFEDQDPTSADEEGEQAELDDVFGSELRIPPDDPEGIRPMLDTSLKRLRLMNLMYQAVIKRRIKSIPIFPHAKLAPDLKFGSHKDMDLITCLDTTFNTLKKIPDIIDDLASAFYDLNKVEIEKRMGQCFVIGSSAVQPLMNNWEGQEDEFSTWASIPFASFVLD